MLIKCDESIINCRDKYGATPLHHTAKCRNVGATKQLLQYPGCAVDISDKNSEYAIHAAARSGCTEIMKMLLKRNKSLVNAKNSRGETLLIIAGFKNIDRKLFECEYSSAKVGDHFDSEESSDEVADDEFDPDDWLFLDHNKQLINVKNDMGMAPLHVACGRFDSNVISGYNQYFSPLDTRISPSSDERKTQLTHDNIARLNTILQHDPSQLNMQTHRGDTALHLACSTGNIYAVRFLLSIKNCSTHKRDKYGNTAFHHAAANARRKILCSVKEQDNFGYTALHYAAYYNQIESMELLLLRDNSVLHVKSWKGKTALHVARIAGSTDAAIFLADIDLSLNFRDNI
ncbi:hypothetical protein B566_EDAN008818, partial [Ephemera danica]